MIGSIHQYASMAAAFTGSLVEAVEAFTIVSAVGTVRGWRSALFGALLGFLTLLATGAAVLLRGGLGIALLENIVRSARAMETIH